MTVEDRGRDVAPLMGRTKLNGEGKKKPRPKARQSKGGNAQEGQEPI
jgi:hypothetical protein